MSLNLAGPFFRNACADGARTALVTDGVTWTYAQLWERASRIASLVPPGRVGVVGTRSPDTYAAVLGICAAGGTYVPLSPRWPAARLRSIAQQSRLSAVVLAPVPGGVAPELFAPLPVIIPGDLASATPFPAPVDVGPDHIAYIIYTSGSTGVPKGVEITAAGVDCFLTCIESLYDLGKDDRLAQFSQLSFDFSVFELFAGWRAGASLWVVPDRSLMSPAEFIKKSELTVWASVPSVISLLQRLKQLAPGSLPSLRISIFSGEALFLEQAQAWRAAAPNSVVDNHYGATEATVMFSIERVGDRPRLAPRHDTVAIGVPYPKMDFAIIDEQSRFVQGTEPGQLVLSGPQLAAGYFEAPQTTAASFVDLTDAQGKLARWYKTGDLVCRDEAGIYYYLGRTDNQIKLRGFRIELGEIEAHLRVVAGTDIVAAVAWPMKAGAAEGIIAFVQGKDEVVSAIHAHLKAHLPAYAMPARIVALERVPLSENGKIDRKALIALLEGAPPPQASRPALPPVEPDERQLARWRDVFDGTYRRSRANADPRFNTTGWMDSFTRKPLPAEAMEEWVAGTVERLRGLEPRRVLEVGCGTGLLLLRLAAECDEYWGTDLSAEALACIQGAGVGPRVRLVQQAAHVTEGLPNRHFDIIILNSVVQYFPSPKYLDRVLDGLMPLLATGGSLFLGDVRHLGLLEHFLTEVSLLSTPDEMAVAEFRERIATKVKHERELLLDPLYFVEFRQRHPSIQTVDVRLKEGTHVNELTKYRYDVVLHLAERPRLQAPEFTGSQLELETFLERERPAAVRLPRIQNALLQSLPGEHDVGTVGTWRASRPPAGGIDPLSWRAWAASRGYRAACSWVPGARDGSYLVHLTRADLPPARWDYSADLPAAYPLTNTPLSPKA